MIHNYSSSCHKAPKDKNNYEKWNFYYEYDDVGIAGL